jgi:aryl-alcohol dehydrogenase-like predicted oxidoreductase
MKYRRLRKSSAWLLKQGDDIVPIPGTNHVANVDQHAAAADLELSNAEVKRLNAIFTPGTGSGPRYADNVLKGVGL